MDFARTRFSISPERVAKARKGNFRILEKGGKPFPGGAGEGGSGASHIVSTLRTVARMWLRIYVPALVGRRGRIEPVCPRRLTGQDIVRQPTPRSAPAHRQEPPESREAGGRTYPLPQHRQHPSTPLV